MTKDKDLTTDEIIWTLLLTKKKLSDAVFQVMKDSAIDCRLNALEHGSKSCYMIHGGGPLFLYDPDYRVDVAEEESTFREEVYEPEKYISMVPAAAASATIPSMTTAAMIPPGLTGAAETRVENVEEVEEVEEGGGNQQLSRITEANDEANNAPNVKITNDEESEEVGV
jgi:hypothetical protein